MTEPALSVSIEPIWGTIRQVRGKVGALLTGYPSEFRSAAMMAASELLENAVKYGDGVPQAPQILFTLGLSDGVLQLRTVNGSHDAQNVERLQARLDRLAASKDPAELYLDAIRAMLTPATGQAGNGLGLYRIVAEGGFALSCQYVDHVVGVLATRRIG
ncbi:MAG: hypothetical protein JW940_31980 [Polyangiaceae bacterium]|nr:hypothetical protein [Polyangiaceae bacterium]